MNTDPCHGLPSSLLRLATAIAALAGAASAQATWTKQAPVPTGSDLYAVEAITADELWAAGGPGVLVHTTDAGQSWQVTSVDSSSLQALFFVDAQRGWAAGNGFFRTTDGGAHWTKVNDWGSISDLHFVDATHGWACGNGGVTYRTTNGGSSWTFKAVGTITTLSSIFFVDLQSGWTADIDGRIYRSTDGGASWTLQWSANDYLSTLQFFDAQEGWAIGGDTFLHTFDGGQSWSPAVLPAGTWSHGARFADRLHGIAVGEYGNIVTTADGGQSWTAIAPIGSGPRLWDVESADAANSVYGGETGGLARTTDGGASWTSLQSGGAGTTQDLDAVDELHAWAANDGGEVLRTDDGATWQRVAVAGFDNYGRLEGVDFVDAARGWAVGRHEAFAAGDGRIVRSDDGGRTWVVQHTVPNAYMEAVEAIDAQTALALGQIPLGPRFILRTSDGGQSWNDVSPSLAVFMDADFVDASTGWVVGGRIYKSTDGGQTWAEQHTPADLLYSVSFADALHGWACGWGPTLLRTSDGGQTWVAQDANAATNVYFRVHAIDAATAWLSGGDGFVARTTDGGQSWQSESVPDPDHGAFTALCFLDAENGWLGGPGIWGRGDGGVGTAFCFGDGGGAPCPCGNFGAAGRGCENSAATGGARLVAAGAASLSSDTLALTSSGELAIAPSVFLQGDAAIAPIAFGDGLRCVGGTLRRLYLHVAASGTVSAPQAGEEPVSARSASLGDAITAGTTRWYQVYYRDPELAFCPAPQGNSWNASSGLAIPWSP